MGFDARVYRIALASPSDVTEERDIAVHAIQHWNDENSAESRVVLLPVRWETHAVPLHGRRPQETINQSVIDGCDLVVAILWTKIGSPTGIADSGTLEEIERAADQGKPVMIFYSQIKQVPDLIDLDQLQRLREFKKKSLPNGLVENYSDKIEFRDKLLRTLNVRVREFGAQEGDARVIGANDDSIKMAFGDAKTGKHIGATLQIAVTQWIVDDIDSVPDYVSPKASVNALAAHTRNKDYYRQLVSWFQDKELFAPILIWLKNEGAIGARDVHIAIMFKGDTPGAVALRRAATLVLGRAKTILARPSGPWMGPG